MIGIPYGLINLWIAWRLCDLLRGSGGAAFAAGALLCALCFPLLFRQPGTSWTRMFFLRLGALWVGLFLYLFLFLLLADIALLCARLFDRALSPATAGFSALGATLCVGLAGGVNARLPVLREYRITGNGTAPGTALRLGVIADLHLGRLNSTAMLAKALHMLAPHRPDALIFLGDVTDDLFLPDNGEFARILQSARPPLGIWGIAGNHEYISGDADAALDGQKRAGIHILRDEGIVLGGAWLVIGRDDCMKPAFMESACKKLPEILAGVPEKDRGLPLIVLDHQPGRLKEAREAGALLQLSGHTHGGQLWPFNLLTAGIFENAHGHALRGGTHSIVSAGTGVWGPPLRTSARPEVLLVHLS